jgi:hypothetical protein
MAERIKLAGWEAALGLVVFALFWIPGALGLAGGIILVATGEVAATGTLIGGLALLTAGLIWFARTIVVGLRQFRVVEVRDDGAWVLKNPLGLTIGRIPYGVQRVVNVKRRETWMFIGTANKYTQQWVEIEAEGKRWRSTRSIPKYQHPAVQALTRPPMQVKF